MSMIQHRTASAKSNRLTIAIAGAGIGGLALALALKRAGFDPVLFEKKSEQQLRTEGLFLTLAPNGMNALRVLGLADEVASGGQVTEGLAIFNEHGKRLGLMDYRRHQQSFGAPSVTLSRGVLSSILLDAVKRAGIELRLEHGIEDVGETADLVSVRAGGTVEGFDLLVACDGLRSRVRQLVFPQMPAPRYSGLIGTGGMVDVPGVAATHGLMNMTFGKRAFFGYLKLPGQPVLWFNTYPAPESDGGPIADPRAYARRIGAMHRDDPLDNRRIMEAVPEIERHYPIYDMPELGRWSTNRVTLMGDAAHAVAPHSGQGASMAIEDGLVLAACLEEAGQPAAAFLRFRKLRHDRTQTAIRIGRQTGSQKHAQSWLALRIRDLVLPLLLPAGVKAQERMFGFRVDRNPLAQPVQ